MALTPESTRALTEAIDKIVSACGSDPQYKDLIGHLRSVERELGGAGESNPKEPARDTATDDYSFETAQKRHTERITAGHNESADAGTDGGEGK